MRLIKISHFSLLDIALDIWINIVNFHLNNL